MDTQALLEQLQDRDAEAELFSGSFDSLEVKFSAGTVKNATAREASGVGVRATKGGKQGFVGSRDMSARGLERLSEVSAGPRVRIRVPHALPMLAAWVDTAQARMRGRSPRVSIESVRMSRHKMFFSSKKARDELGLPQSSVTDALARAVAFFRDQGHVA